MPDTPQKFRLRVSHSGAISPDPNRTGSFIYDGGHTYLESVPVGIGYADFIFRLSEKTSSGVSVKYSLPGEDLRPENLITISDNSDLEEMFEEYMRGLRVPGTPIRTFRLRVFLFGVVEVPYSVDETMTAEELADAHSFFNYPPTSSGKGSTTKVAPSTGPRLSMLSSAPSSGNTPQSGVRGGGITSTSTAVTPLSRTPLQCPLPDPPDEDLATWQAGFVAGQEAAAFEAQLPSGSLDHESSGALMSPYRSQVRFSETPNGADSFSKDFAPFPLDRNWPDASAHDEDCGAWVIDGAEISCQTSGGNVNPEPDGNSLLKMLPSNISAFGGCSNEPLEPEVPPVKDRVTSGVCLPSHISVFGDMSNDDKQPPPLPLTSLSDTHHPLPGQFQTAARRLLMPRPTGATFKEEESEEVSPLRGELERSEGLWTPQTSSPKTLFTSRVHCVPQSEVVFGKRIGGGAFGDVYVATSPTFGEVAVKWLKQDQIRHGGMLQINQSFGAEAEVLASVNHPNVLRFYGVVTRNEKNPTIAGIMTEYIRGGSLSDLIRQQLHNRVYMPLRLRCEIAAGAVKGLAYLHKMRIVHFDLKPDNLLLEHSATGVTVKVADFGLHKHKRGNDSFVSDILDLRGTLPYMAPELVNDSKHVSEKADIWSLGMVLYEMVVLRVPFSELKPQEIVKALMTAAHPTDNLLPKVPQWCEPVWAKLIQECWAVAPAARPNLQDLARKLEAIADSPLCN